MERKIFIDLPEHIDSNTFSSLIVPALEEKMKDPQTRFLFTMKHIFLLRYLASRKYRKCTVYLPTGEKPLAMAIGYNIINVSAAEMYITMKYECEEILSFNTETKEVSSKSI